MLQPETTQAIHNWLLQEIPTIIHNNKQTINHSHSYSNSSTISHLYTTDTHQHRIWYYDNHIQINSFTKTHKTYKAETTTIYYADPELLPKLKQHICNYKPKTP